MSKDRPLKVAKESDPLPGRPAHVDPAVWQTHGGLAQARSRSEHFVAGVFAAPRGRILTDPAEIKALRDEKRRADTDY